MASPSPLSLSSSVRYDFVLPSADLRNIISGFFIYRNDDENWQEEFAFDDGHGAMVFILHPGNKQTFYNKQKHVELSQAYVAKSSLAGYYMPKSDAHIALFGCRFTLQGLYALFGPAVAWGDESMLSLADIAGAEGAALAERVLLADNLADARALVESFIRKHQRYQPINFRFEEMAAEIRAKQGNLRMRDLVRSNKLNQRWLERYFKLYVGMTPKSYARLWRFMPAYFDYRKSDSNNWQDLALAHNYYDTKHFVDEFKLITGKHPTSFKTGDYFDLANWVQPVYYPNLVLG